VSGTLYLPPARDVQQGDLYEDMPSVVVVDRPLRVGRPATGPGARELIEVFREGGAEPPGGFMWQPDGNGEQSMLVQGRLSRAMILSHDCEIDNDPRIRIIAMVRPLTDLVLAAQEEIKSGVERPIRYGIFPLGPQVETPAMDWSFVDFRRLTTVRPVVLEKSVRIASLSNPLRHAVADAFRLYLFRPVEGAR
jgi:hypothetical protein